MSERSTRISKLLTDKKARAAYIKAKLGILVPSQIRALRLKFGMPRQLDLAKEAVMQQSRISMLETPGAANVTLETLARLAAVFKVGLVVRFVPFSEMLHWENTFSQDEFDVIRLNEDKAFLSPVAQSIPNELVMAEKQPSLIAQGIAVPRQLSPTLVGFFQPESGASSTDFNFAQRPELHLAGRA